MKEKMEKRKVFIYSVFDGVWHFLCSFTVTQTFACLTSDLLIFFPSDCSFTVSFPFTDSCDSGIAKSLCVHL